MDDFAARLTTASTPSSSATCAGTPRTWTRSWRCEAHGIPVIEDAAHSPRHQWHGRNIGTIGRVGCFSFQSYKLLNSGEGGMMITDDADLMARAVIMSGAYEHNWPSTWRRADPALATPGARGRTGCRFTTCACQPVRRVILPATGRAPAPRARWPPQPRSRRRAAERRHRGSTCPTSWPAEEARARFDPVQPRRHGPRPGRDFARRRRARRQGAGLRAEHATTRAPSGTGSSSASPRAAADPRHADAGLRCPPARAADRERVRHRRRGAPAGRRGDGGPRAPTAPDGRG